MGYVATCIWMYCCATTSMQKKILVEYDNGELETIEITRAEPDEGFNPPVWEQQYV